MFKKSGIMEGMTVRRRILPDGWYPSDRVQLERVLSSWTAPEDTRTGVSCIVPHAGWYFSGELTFQTLSRLRPGIDTLVVVGGHLPAGSRMLAAAEDGYETPLGILKADLDLKAELEKEIVLLPDNEPDNTVEVILPMIAWLFKDAGVLWLRAPQDMSASKAGASILGAAERTGKTVAVVGSTDLTHYGRSYGFSPRGRGREALDWVRDENDGGIIRAFLDMDEESTLEFAVRRRAACSAGGALAAISFARGCGVDGGTLTGYLNSADIHPSDSFVGYAGIVYG